MYWLIIKNEWQYWRRSQLVLASTLLFLLLIATTSLFNLSRMHDEQHLRSEQQATAEQTFLAQPDRHPHRMVHYGHYVFRTPSPLAVFDPGLDPVTGQAIFLEGHRQNTATFTEASASPALGGLALTPARVYQYFAPLLIILVGYTLIAREREAGTLIPLLATVRPRQLVLGKTLALLSYTTLLLVPLLLLSFLVQVRLLDWLSVMASYWLFLSIWVLLTSLVTLVKPQATVVLALLAGLWLSMSLVVPAIAINIVAALEPPASKLLNDIVLNADLRQLGDGHNAKDAAFNQLRDEVLAQYQVERIEDLPINYRGLVAVTAERDLTALLNQYAQARFDHEQQQRQRIAQFGWLSPTLAISFASRTLAATDLDHYHRFQQQAEAIRFDFVQGLNQAHVDQLSYQDDINRNNSVAAGLRARVDAGNWQVLDQYTFQPVSLAERLTHAQLPLRMLLAWLMGISLGLIVLAPRLQP